MDIGAGAASAAANNTVEHRSTAKCKACLFTPGLITYIIIATGGGRRGNVCALRLENEVR
jgi:hypothetical protein